MKLKLGEIDHRWLDGLAQWVVIRHKKYHVDSIMVGEYMRNRKLAMKYVAENKKPNAIFLGDSLIQATVGTFKGPEGLKGVKAAQKWILSSNNFMIRFSKDTGGWCDRLILGISEKESPYCLLWMH